jgi:hypothetical protein
MLQRPPMAERSCWIVIETVFELSNLRFALCLYPVLLFLLVVAYPLAYALI